MSSKNKIFSILVCSLLCTTIFITPIECARKSNTRRGGSGSSGGGGSKPQSRPSSSSSQPSSPSATNSHAHSQSDNAKLSYSNYNSAPPRPSNVDNSQIGWKAGATGNHNQAPPPYSANANNGPPPAYSANANAPGINSRFNEAPPVYQQPAHQGLGAGHAAPQYPAGSYQPNTHSGGSFQQPGYHPAAAGYQPGYQPAAAGYQPGYQPAAAGYQPGYQPGHQPGYQGPPIVNNYHTPAKSSSIGSGLQTAAIAGIGGVALYAALKPGETKTIYINNGTNQPAPAAEPAAVPAAIPAAALTPNNGQPTSISTPTPLAPLPPLYAGPINPMNLPDNRMMPGFGSVYDPMTNTMVNCSALIIMDYDRNTFRPNVNNDLTVTMSTIPIPPTQFLPHPIPTMNSTETNIPIIMSSIDSNAMMNITEIIPVMNITETNVMTNSTRMFNATENNNASTPITTTSTVAALITAPTIPPVVVPQICKDMMKTFLSQSQTPMNPAYNVVQLTPMIPMTSSNVPLAPYPSEQPAPVVSAVKINSVPINNTNMDRKSEQLKQNNELMDGKSFGIKLDFSVLTILVPFVVSLIVKV